MTLTIIPDDRLAADAARLGPDSTEARVVADLARRRARDEQVSAFEINGMIVVGPTSAPTAEAEMAADIGTFLSTMREDP
jgi:hypothetical protein